ncbi:unnamed protein product [Calicophoron daubneyi]|uniref:Protein SDA1 n=1 Tax=Calicophoron daubneyi TaxID=300641 RepID=A0AAV2TJB3_CALDB
MSADALPLADLQYNLKRDPVTYKPDFERYYEHYQALQQSFLSAPSQHIEKLAELLLFLSQVIQFYPDYVEGFSSGVIQILLSRAFGMHPDMRLAFMKAFMRLKSKDLLPLIKAVDVAFKLHRCQDKQVRQAMRTFLVHDIKRLNRRQKQNKLNTAAQSYLSRILKDNNPAVAREAAILLVRLFKKNVWNDARTANLIADACLAKRKKVYDPAVRFFLAQDKAGEAKDSDSESDSELNKEKRIKQLRLGHRVAAKTKNREKRLERSIEHVTKAVERKSAKSSNFSNYLAINLLHDPQSFAERLLRKLERCSDRFEIRLLLLDLITRLVGLHKLVLLNLYPFLQRFLRPQQREVTRLLLFAAQASHDEVPPDVMEPLVRTIADNFITDRASSEAIAVGLNSVREICARCPYAVTEDLLSDLVQYKTYRNKNVVAAARSLIRLFRQINPALLPRKERGRPTESQVESMANFNSSSGLALSFGQTVPAFSVPGAEALVLAETLASNRSAAVGHGSKVSEGKKKATSEKLTGVQGDAAHSVDMDEKASSETTGEVDDNESDHDSASASEDDEEEEELDDEEEDGDEEEGEDGMDEEDIECAQEKDLGDESGMEVEAVKDKPAKKLVKNKDHPSEGEDVDSDGWVDVPQSSDECETELETAEAAISRATLTSKATEIASSRIFTQEEFEAMRRYQQNKQKKFAAFGSGNKRKANDPDSMLTIPSDDEGSDGENESEKKNPQPHHFATLSDITRLVKRPRQSKAERLEAIQTGREGREKYGFKVNRMNPHASTTNREKSKKKVFTMVKHKAKQKIKRSFHDKQIALREHLKRLMKMR